MKDNKYELKFSTFLIIVMLLIGSVCAIISYIGHDEEDININNNFVISKRHLNPVQEKSNNIIMEEETSTNNIQKDTDITSPKTD